jgi:hypothetical protein
MFETVSKQIELVTNLCIDRPKFLHESLAARQMISPSNQTAHSRGDHRRVAEQPRKGLCFHGPAD